MALAQSQVSGTAYEYEIVSGGSCIEVPLSTRGLGDKGRSLGAVVYRTAPSTLLIR